MATLDQPLLSKPSNLTQLGIKTWLLGEKYQTELNRDIQWYSSWASHYFSKGGLGVAIAALEIIPILILSCPIINEITYIAFATLFPAQNNQLLLNTLEEENAIAAYILIERGADQTLKNSKGKTVLDLFAEKAERQQGLSTQDLTICTDLFKRGLTPKSISHKGFVMMLETTLKQKRHELALPLLSAGVQLASSWTAYIPQPTEDVVKLPDWSRSKLPTVSYENDFGTQTTIPLGEDINAAAAKTFVQKFSPNGMELPQLMRIYRQTICNCPIILGEDESERESLVYALTRKILSEDPPSYLQKKRVIGIDLATLDNLNKISEINSLLKAYTQKLESNPNFIFYVHNFDIFSRSTKNSHHAVQQAIIKWAQTARVIFSMKPIVYKRFFEKDRDVQQSFTTCKVSKSTATEVFPFLYKKKRQLEMKHQVLFSNQAFNQANFMSRYLKNASFPQTPLQLLDAAAILMKEQETKGSFAFQEARQKKRQLLTKLQEQHFKNRTPSEKWVAQLNQEIQQQTGRIAELKASDEKEIAQQKNYTELRAQKIFLEALDEALKIQARPLIEKVKRELQNFEAIKKNAKNIKFEVDGDLIARIVSERATIPLSHVHRDEARQLVSFADRLSEHVIGQNEAVEKTANAIIRARTGFRDESKPRAVFLYAGPTGVGKTELAKALTKTLFGNTRNMTRLDMSEYSERGAKSRLIGPPPGYVGYSKGGQLTEALKRNPYQVVLIDEAEKASPEVLTIFLQVFDDGRLTDGQGHTVDCSQAIFIMTTNLGSRNLIANEDSYKGLWSLIPKSCRRQQKRAYRNLTEQAIIQSPHFPPELYNRLDAVIRFLPLTNLSDLQKIADKILTEVQTHAMNRNGIDLTWTSRAVKQLAREGRNPLFGARPLKRLIDEVVQTSLANDLVAGAIKEGDSIQLDYEPSRRCYKFNKIAAATA